MCGIAGFFGYDQIEEKAMLLSSLLAHRGPDASGIWYQQGACLVHRRLSILDLSEAANQPFESANGRYMIVFNGEVFNYEQIAWELCLQLRTHSDTEVVVEAFAKIGKDCAAMFNGMFALAIYDKAENKFYLLRDRVGIKPLFVYQDAGRFAFASELNALVAGMGLSPKLDPYALANFLHLGYIPENQTIYEGIHKFPAGCWGVFDGKKLELEPYWEPEAQLKAELLNDPEEAKTQLKTLLSHSVRLHMISDVQVGTFLSGGIDSSLITAIAQHHSYKPLKTFTIGFKEARHDESSYAKLVAAYLGTDHQRLVLSEREAMNKITLVPKIYGQPFADSSALPTLLVSQLASGQVKVVLSGDGGDELFMGYGMYRWAQWLGSRRGKLFAPLLRQILRLRKTPRNLRVADLLELPEPEYRMAHIFSQEQYMFSRKEIARLLLPDYPKAPAINQNPVPERVRPLSPVEQQAFFDFKNYLKDDLLVKVDISSMHYGLEVRVPLLDYRIAEFAFNLSPALRKEKQLLKEVLFDYVPASLFDRPKWGFSIPLAKWLKGGLAYLIEEYLSEKVINECGFVHYPEVQRYKSLFQQGYEHYYNRLWVLIMLHKWAKGE